MPAGGDTLVLLLPERRRFAGQALDARMARTLGRADRLADAAPGETAQLQRHFAPEPAGWPMAAITRAADCGDTGSAAWLRADPAFVRAEMAGVRLMATGDIALAPDEADALLEPLRPVFAEAGLPISAGGAGRWYLRVDPVVDLPAFAPPADALGSDVFPFLPAGADGRRWRALFNEAQVLLHNHPRNAARTAVGLPPVNSLWFWGGGTLPARVDCTSAAVLSEDAEVRALARLAGARAVAGETGSVLADLRRERDWTRVQDVVLADALNELGVRYDALELDFADGTRFALRRGHRWRFWRRPLDPRA
jgi:hypothetical protein